ncbi:MAG: TIGR03546 family protein [Gammaproteobacteria bacterium]|nr:TIGR03546 family protein [Gammaproteobacteria bacterium]MDH5728712.1 TIGR03546 family protein [Gammaproteobacteria bacterium]
MFWLKMLADLIRAIQKSASPRQLAAGFVLGFCFGLIPGWPLQVIIILLLIIFFNVNIALAMIGATLGPIVGWLFDPMLDSLGLWLLRDIAALQDLWIAMYNNTAAMLTRFNNTVVMGSSALAIIFSIPLYFLLSWAVTQYREKLMIKIRGLRIFRAVMESRLFSLVMKSED